MLSIVPNQPPRFSSTKRCWEQNRRLQISVPRGPDPRIPSILKPDLIAPGSLVLAASVPGGAYDAITIGGKSLYPDNYLLMSGTSMSCPHVSGIAALLKGAHPHWSPAAIRSAMMTMADTMDSSGAWIKDGGMNHTEASPLGMGAGHVNPNKALDPGLVYDATIQDYINFLCSMNLTRARISSIHHQVDQNRLLHPFRRSQLPVLHSTGTVARTFSRTVTNVGDGAATYVAKVDVPFAINADVYPATLKFRETGEKQSYTPVIRNRVKSFESSSSIP